MLSEDIINKIAAGEVVERPASVVKELVENSLDAGSTQIIVEIKEAGKKLIKVIDNGEGMDEEDAKKSILRHATSKIKTQDDLFNIISLGFRGEALASISAVSRLQILTKKRIRNNQGRVQGPSIEHREENLEGYQINVEGGQITRSTIAAANLGTSITIRDLFFNTPARKKFLKSDLVELKHIIDIITKYALANPHVSFKLINEGKEILNATSTEHQRTNISYIYGSSIAKDLLKVSRLHEENAIKVEGYISKPLSARNDKTQQAFFVNGRWVKNASMSQAVYDAYHSLLFTGKHPIFILNVDLDPKSIDVNVHPNKTEIKVEQKEIVYQAVYNAVHEALRKNNLIPEFTLEVEEQITFGEPKPQEKSPYPKYAFEKSEQTVFPDTNAQTNTAELQLDTQATNNIEKEMQQESTASYSTTYTNPKVKEASEIAAYGSSAEQIIQSARTEELTRPEHQHENFIAGSIRFPPMKVLGQIHKTFFVAETPGGMLLIDQHVVQERVLYERFMTEYLNKKVETQQLLEKELLTFTAAEKAIVEKHIWKLKDFGFTLEHFGENDYFLSSMPTIFGRNLSKELVYIIIKEIAEGKVKELERLQEEIITRMACRASVKAGDTMTIPQIKKLMKELVDCNLPYTCPHGRAIVAKISAEELEKKFLRHG